MVLNRFLTMGIAAAVSLSVLAATGCGTRHRDYRGYRDDGRYYRTGTPARVYRYDTRADPRYGRYDPGYDRRYQPRVQRRYPTHPRVYGEPTGRGYYDYRSRGDVRRTDPYRW
jgi:hypothetical protein